METVAIMVIETGQLFFLLLLCRFLDSVNGSFLSQAMVL